MMSNMTDAKFIKNKEDFKCEKCGFLVSGDGFTNHCPRCLWSKHVDNNPGDRANECGGMMRPVKVGKEGENYSLIHQCEKCGGKKKNKISEMDDFEKIVEIAEISNNVK